jgi:hypothetical protein
VLEASRQQIPAATAPPGGIPPSTDAATDAVEVVVFRAGGVTFAAPCRHIGQVQRRRATAGVFDLAAEMGGRAQADLVLALRGAAGGVRLQVDEVVEVARLPMSAIHALPRLAAERHDGGYVVGVVVRQGELAVLLDVEQIAAAHAEALSAPIRAAP